MTRKRKSEPEIRVDPEFESLIPPLTSEEFSQLRENILERGECNDPIHVWGEPGKDYYVIVDGHNRWRIIQENKEIHYKIHSMIFFSREDAKEWIIRNQLGRRNIPDYVKAELALKLKPQIAARAKENQSTHTEGGYHGLEKSTKAVNTREELASIAGVSSNTIAKVEKIVESASDDVKNELRAGKLSINKAYNQMEDKPSETVKEAFALYAPSKYKKEFDRIAKGHMENLQLASDLFRRMEEDAPKDTDEEVTLADIASDIAKAMWYFHKAYGVPMPDFDFSRHLNDIWTVDRKDEK